MEQDHQGTVNGTPNGLCSETLHQLVGDVPISDNCVSTTSGLGEAFDGDAQHWEINGSLDGEEDEYINAVMCAVTSSGNEGSGFLKARKGGFHKAFKSKTSWLPKLQLPKGIFQRSSCKTSEPSQTNNLSKTAEETKKTYTNLSPSKTLGCATTDQTKIKITGSRRRQNSTSSTSTFYGSMSSDVSTQSQDTSKRNQGSYTTQSMHSAPSSCDPLSLWGSCRSSEVSSIDGLSPSSSIRIKTLQADGLCPISTPSNPVAPVNKCDDNQNFAASAPLIDQKDTVNYYNSCHNEIKTPEDSKLCPSEQLEPNVNDRYTPMQSNPQFLPHRNTCSNQNTDWNQNNIYEKDMHASKNISESVTLDCNKDLILPDDVVSYLNEVSQQEVESSKSFYQNPNSFQSPIKTDCCSNCKIDPHQNPPLPNSYCNHLPVTNTFYQNCSTQHHTNINSSNCISHDANRINCNDVQNNFNPNSVNYQSNGCKNEYIPQSCHQGASQHLINHCPQQVWNAQNAQPVGTMQNQVCSTHGMNTFYCNQQHYNNTPTYQITPQYNSNNLHIHSPSDNRCSMGNCIESQTMHAPPVYCNYQQVHQFSNQQTGFKCSQMCDTSNGMQPQCHQVPPNYNIHHQQGPLPQNPNCFHQYQQCVNCGVGQNLPPNHCFSSNTVPNRNNTSHFISPNHVIQCLPQQNLPHVVDGASLEVVVPKSEKTDFEKQNYVPPKTEAVSVSCANSVSKERTTPVPNQNTSFQNAVSQVTENVPNASLTHVQSLLPTSNMVINDMNSILSSLMEETKYLKLLQ